MTKHTPATPLPWEHSMQYVQAVEGHMSLAHCYGGGNSSYIAHACNAYPKLVEALRSFNVPRIADDDCAPHLLAARALLRSLGEDA
jgi:hypothetical protein